MPYIPFEKRQVIESKLFEFLKDVGKLSPGELNYSITRIILDFLGDDPHYKDFATVIGVLENVKEELYRRKVAPYENKKIEDEGDVY